VKSVYEIVKTKVKYFNELSDDYNCMLGVRQGESLSPFLFSMFVNDIEKTYINSGVEGIDIGTFKLFLLLYADDIVLLAKSAEELQNYLDILKTYCDEWKLKVNESKTKVMIFRKGGRLPNNLRFKYGEHQLDIVNKFNYLGIVFTSGGSFAEAHKTLAGQALKAIFKINKYLYKFTFINVKHRLELFDKLVMPILNYACQVWGFAQAQCIERKHLHFCKSILRVKKTTQNDFVYGELGRTSCQINRILNIIKYWLKILHMGENKYVKIIYKLMLSDIQATNTIVNWASLLRNVLSSLGFNEAWLSQGVGNESIFVNLVNQRLTDQIVQNWQSRLENSSRALLYSQIATFRFQPYLETFNCTKFCNAITRLRVSSHRLAIETGRWQRPASIPITERKCRTCGILEDEYHFVLECTLYKELREKFIPKYFWQRPNMYKFITLINSEKDITIKKLGLYTCNAFKLQNG